SPGYCLLNQGGFFPESRGRGPKDVPCRTCRQHGPGTGQVATSQAGASQGPRHQACPLRGAKRPLLNRLLGAMTLRVGELGAAAVDFAAVAVASARRNPLLQLDNLEAAFALRWAGWRGLGLATRLDGLFGRTRFHVGTSFRTNSGLR